jgi:hypothetical protein
MNGKIKYNFSAEVWRHASPGGWCFVSLPESMAREIRALLKSQEEGWGRLKATAEVGETQWKTAIWFDSKRNTYLLPLKSDIRKFENLITGKIIDVTIWL